MILFINACFRDGSRTLRLAHHYLSNCADNVATLALGDMDIKPLNRNLLKEYNKAVESADYGNAMFDIAKQFISADEIVIAAPFWNFGFPAELHVYLEHACTQGISFDISESGDYYSLCKAKKLTYITTAGGYIPEDDHAFGYIKTLCEKFWKIEDIKYYKAEGIDIAGNDSEALTEQVMHEMDEHN